MFGIGFPELVLILIVALVVFGPKQLPEVARSIGKGLREIKKVTSEVTDITDLSKPLDSSEAKISPNPANPNRPAVAPIIKLEDENGEILDSSPDTLKDDLEKQNKAAVKDKTHQEDKLPASSININDSINKETNTEQENKK